VRWNARNALQSFRRCCSNLGVPTSARPPESAARSEFSSAQVPPLLVWRSHYAVGRFLGSVVFPSRTTLATVKRTANPLVELGLPVSLTQQNLAGRPKPTSSSLGLPFPSAHEEPQVHLPRVLPARYVPPSGFGYPLDGFLPAIPRRFCFAPAALLGFTLRSFLLPEGILPVSGRKNPPTVPPVGIPAPKCGPARQAAVPGFQPFRESLATTRGVSTRTAGCSPGFRPSRASTNALARISPCLLSRASPARTVHPDGGAPECRSASAPLHPPPQTSREYRLEHPSGVSAPAWILKHSGRATIRAILFASHRAAHYCRLTDAL
jgi:hypothetical protein